MQFDLVLTNPPFQDSRARGKTRHKLWIDFTRRIFGQVLADGGMLCQVSPASFQSASSPILSLMKANHTRWIRFDTARYFPHVGSSFADYLIEKRPSDGDPTVVEQDGVRFELELDPSVFYLPNDFCATSVSIHRKVMLVPQAKLDVRWDYVTCHNVLATRRPDILGKTRTSSHRFPVFHTNRQIWWSSVRQPFASLPKVMWSRSGYTLPFYDPGRLGGTDMAYYVPVTDSSAGRALAANMNLKLFRYIYATARWSGFGNERVFAHLPSTPQTHILDDAAAYALYGLSDEEVAYVERSVG